MIQLIFDTEKDLENQNFAIFDSLLDSFGRRYEKRLRCNSDHRSDA